MLLSPQSEGRQRTLDDGGWHGATIYLHVETSTQAVNKQPQQPHTAAARLAAPYGSRTPRSAIRQPHAPHSAIRQPHTSQRHTAAARPTAPYGSRTPRSATRQPHTTTTRRLERGHLRGNQAEAGLTRRAEPQRARPRAANPPRAQPSPRALPPRASRPRRAQRHHAPQPPLPRERAALPPLALHSPLALVLQQPKPPQRCRRWSARRTAYHKHGSKRASAASRAVAANASIGNKGPQLLRGQSATHCCGAACGRSAAQRSR